MKIKVTLIAVLLLTQLYTPTLAQENPIDRSDFYSNQCVNEDEPLCVMYIHGFMKGATSSIQILESLSNNPGFSKDQAKGIKAATRGVRVLTGCPPESVSAGQGTKVWLKYLKDHPEDLHLTPPETVSASFNAAFPCE